MGGGIGGWGLYRKSGSLYSRGSYKAATNVLCSYVAPAVGEGSGAGRVYKGTNVLASSPGLVTASLGCIGLAR